MRRIVVLWLLASVLVLGAPPARAADPAEFTRTQDVIYGRKFGTALTLDVFTPKKGANGGAIIWAVSGGWFSNHDTINPVFITELVHRGYTVFAVVHGSQPKFTIPEILDDMNRAVRFIRFHARDYHVDPNRIGMTGASAGGHLSLMQGTTGDKGNAGARDPVDQVPSRIQCVACFFPPTDFLNFGVTGYMLNKKTAQVPFKAAFDFHDVDKETRLLVPITDDEKVRELCRKISPINHVNRESAPCLIIHGDADKLVPIQQAEIFVARCKEVGVPVELVVKKGAAHGWPTILGDMTLIADWFDKHIGKAAEADKQGN
jgi:acetyl esterase/lipase